MKDITEQSIRDMIPAALKREIFAVYTRNSAGSAVSPGEFTPDRHAHREILFALDGTCGFPIENKLIELRPGTAALLGEWDRHSYGYRACDSGLLHLWVHFNGFTATGSILHISEHGEYHPDTHFVYPRALSAALLERWKQLESIENPTPEMDHFYLKSLLNALLEETSLQYAAGVEHRNGRPANAVERVRLHIERVNGRECSLDTLSRISGYGRFHLAHLFREYTGKTIGDWIDEVRIQYMETAMKHGLSGKEIAMNLGFSSPGAFWNWKKKIARVDPAYSTSSNL